MTRHPVTSLSLRSRMEEVPRAVKWLQECCGAERIPREVMLDLRLALDELVTNIIRHGYGPSAEGGIEVRLEVLPGKVRLELRDQAIPFDPRSAPGPLLEGTSDSRPVGGLGIHLVRSRMDRIDYKHQNGENRLLLERSVPAAR